MERHYFDHNATTPVSAEVLEAMLPCFDQAYGNASSIHRFGQEARQKYEEARRRVARMLACDAGEIVFLSGGTEADNLAVLGTAPKHVVTSAIEHPAVLAACAQLDQVTTVRVGPDGIVDPDEVRQAMRPDTGLISVMHANNELGTIQPIAELARIAHEAGALFHSDGVQAVGKVPLQAEVDLYSLSGHKFYAPKGVGALMVRAGVSLSARSFGGHHERGLRAGTDNVPGVVGLGRAAEWITQNLEAEAERLGGLRDRLENSLLERIPGTHVNGHRSLRTPNTANLRFDAIDGEALVIALDLKGYAVSSGAACSSGAVEPSHVLTAIGLSRDQARSSIRFSLGRQNTAEEVEALVEAVVAAVVHLRKISPVSVAHVQ